MMGEHPNPPPEEGKSAILREFEAALRRREKPDVEEWLGRAAPSDRAELREHLEALLSGSSPKEAVPKELWPTEDVSPAEAQASPSGPAPRELKSGDKLGKYVVEEHLGGGAFGSVYRAEDTVLKRKVALKVPTRDRFPSGDAFELYLQEAQAIAQLDHPGIVPVYDHGELEGEQGFYLVLKYIEGGSLAEFLKSEKPSWEQSVQIMLAISEAVGVIHGAGYRHRDLKPANILLDAEGKPHVSDFGLAIHEDLQHLRRGELGGTLPYMSPEQVRGEVDRLDGRSDIWSLGVILYELLTGHLPFQETNEILDRDPVPVSQRAPDIPVQLDEICQRCLARQIGERYPSASALANELRSFLGTSLREPLQVAVVSDHRIQIANLTIVSRSVGSEALPAEPAKLSHEGLGANPYRGLGAFREQDADLFFGREEQVDRLYEQLGSLYGSRGEKTPRILPILGPSGCGKSSLARAGLISELARRPLAGWHNARAAVFTPGSRPLESLANVLARVVTDDAAPVAKSDEFLKTLRGKDGSGRQDGLRRIASMLPEIDSCPLVLFVDQFEEIYTQCEDEDERLAFIDNLLEASSDKSGHLSVVLTLRSDFLGETQEYQVFNGVVCKQGVIVPAMSAEELRRAITEPARQAGYHFEKAIVDLLIRETRDREGSLPLLQFALMRIWKGLEEGIDAAETLERIGGVGGALAGEAQRIYEALPPEDQPIVRRAFQAMVQLGEGTQDTRRRVTFEEIVSATDNPQHVHEVLSRFAEPGCRLVTLSAADEGRDVAEVTHEALFEHWQTLREWVDRNRDDIRLKRRLEEAARHWDEERRPAGLLWRVPDVDLLKQYVGRAKNDLTPLQLEFCELSEKLRWQEIQRQRREARRLWAAIAMFSTIVCLIVIALLTYQKQRLAEDLVEELQRAADSEAEQRKRAETEEINAKTAASKLQAAQATASLSGTTVHHPEDSHGLLQFLESLRVADGIRQISPSLYAVWAAWYRTVQGRLVAVVGHDGDITDVDLSKDGALFATGSSDGCARVWRTDDGTAITKPMIHRHPTSSTTEEIRQVLLTPRADVLVTFTRNGIVRVWGVQESNMLRSFAAADGQVSQVALGPKGKLVAMGTTTGQIIVQNVESGEQIADNKQFPSAVTGLCLDLDGARLAACSESEIRCWEFPGNKLLFNVEHRGDKLALSPDGTMLATVDQGTRTMWLWDVTTGRQKCVIETDHPNIIWNIAFSPDNKLIASASAGDEAGIWNTSNGELVGKSQTFYGDVLDVRFSPDSKYLAIASREGAVRIWNPRTDEYLGAAIRHSARVCAIEYSPLGSFIISGGEDGTARIWDIGYRPEQRIWHGEAIRSVDLSPNGARVITASNDGTSQVWDVETGQPIGDPISAEPSVSMLDARFIDDDTVITASASGKLQLWNALDQTSVAEEVQHEELCVMELSPRRKFLATGTTGGSLKIWSVEGGELRLHADLGNPHRDRIWVLCFSTNEELLASGSDDRTIQLWRNIDGEAQGPRLNQNAVVRAVTFDPTGTILATGGWDSNLRLWNTKTGQPLGRPLPHFKAVLDAVFSPDGRFLVTASEDRFLRIWDTTTWRLHVEPIRHLSLSSQLVFRPNSRMLAAGWGDGRATLWQVDSGLPMGQFSHPERISRLAFDRSGQLLATASYDGSVQLLRFPKVPQSLREAELRTWVALGDRLNELGTFEPVPWREWQAMRDKLLRDYQAAPTWNRVEREAVNLVESLYDQLVLKTDVLSAIQNDVSLDAECRKIALRHAEEWREHPIRQQLRLADLAKALIDPSFNAPTSVRPILEFIVPSLVDAAETATRELGADSRAYVETIAKQYPKNAYVRCILGMAQFRAGDVDTAVKTLTEANQLISEDLDSPFPMALTFLSMAEHKRGNDEAAREALKLAQEVANKNKIQSHRLLAGLFREAETLLIGNKVDNEPKPVEKKQ